MNKKIDIVFKKTSVGFKRQEFDILTEQCGIAIDKGHDMLKKSHKILLAYHNEQIIGFITTVSNGVDFVYYDKIGIRKDYRGKGIGIKLFAFISKYYKNIPVQTVLAKKNMVKFYQNFGFNIIDKQNASRVSNYPMIRINYSLLK